MSTAHVAVITTEAPKITGFHLVEAQVVTIAQTVEPGELRRILGILADQCRPEARDHTAEDLHQKRSLSLSETPNGMFRLDGYLDLVAGTGATRGAHHPDGPHSRDDQRTAKQRRADALTDLTTAGQANTNPLGSAGLRAGRAGRPPPATGGTRGRFSVGHPDARPAHLHRDRVSHPRHPPQEHVFVPSRWHAANAPPTTTNGGP